MVPVIIGVGMVIIAIGEALGISSCSDGNGGERRKEEDGRTGAPDGGPKKPDAHSHDGGKTRDAGDAGSGRDGSVDANNQHHDGSVGMPDAGPIVRPGVNDNFAKMPCNALADLDVVGDKLIGLCRISPLKIFQCQTTTHLESSVCTPVATLSEVVNNRRVTPVSHEDLGSGKSLVTFTSQGNDSRDTGIGVFFVDENTGDISETFSFHSVQYISAGGNTEVTPTTLNSALIFQNQLFLATQSYYDISDDGIDPALRGQIFAFSFTQDGHVNSDILSGAILATGQDNPLHLVAQDEPTILSINGGGPSQSGMDRINAQMPPQITGSDNLGSTPLKALPNLAIAGDGNLAIMASASAPWKLSVVDLANRRILQERNTPEVGGGIVGIVSSGMNVFVTDADGHLLSFDFSTNQIGRLLNNPTITPNPGPLAIYGGIIYQSASGTDPRIVAIDPQQVE